MAVEAYVGELRLIAFNFAPVGWAMCHGQLLPAQDPTTGSDTPLFSLLGATFGGNGRDTFALPDLRGRVPVGVGRGPGLSNIYRGQKGGKEEIELTSYNIPPLSGTVNVTTETGNVDSPKNALLAKEAAGATFIYNNTASANAPMKADSITTKGGNAPVGIRNPYVGMNWIICEQGIYPAQD
ncbi:MAG: tail fiber protein [Chloroflexota bacterium]